MSEHHSGETRESPQASSISTELIRVNAEIVIMRATVTKSSGASASAHAQEDAKLSGALERAEDRAIERARAMLDDGRASQSPATAIVPPATFEMQAEPPQPEPVEVLTSTPPPPPELDAAPDDDADPPLEDYSWTAFWRWARKHGYESKVEVETLIGESITSASSPAHIRNALRAKTGIPAD
jgi:hypothetical protein